MPELPPTKRSSSSSSLPASVQTTAHSALPYKSKMHRQLNLSPGLKQPQQQQQQQYDCGGGGGGGADAAEVMDVPEESTAAKAGGRSAREIREERSIHLIPLLTFLCFLLLFLFSHDPSSSDMSSFSSGGIAGNRRLRML
ncbi:hypothetical protein GUJ93_ZPchr0002g23107 [Zizania palustris]|uniref:Uncharacterized protein n=1 Tax=Zizania palustris TaxID=103762 RepID=A0A8J5RWY5_ZIZPA|nr:hypothetical protein GUJ93_ZPchr0002g23107 [Zizania palustris]